MEEQRLKSMLELNNMLLDEEAKNIDLQRKLNTAALRELEAKQTIRQLQLQLAETKAVVIEPPKPAAKPIAPADSESLATAADTAARLADLRAQSVANILRATWSKAGRIKLYAQIEARCMDPTKAFHRYNATQFIFKVLEPDTYAAGCREKILDELDFSDFVWAEKRSVKPPSAVTDPVDLALQLEANNKLAEKRAQIRLAILRQTLTKSNRAYLRTQVHELVRSLFPALYHGWPAYDALFMPHCCAIDSEFFEHCKTHMLDKLNFE
jgi:hypothetical protein